MVGEIRWLSLGGPPISLFGRSSDGTRVLQGTLGHHGDLERGASGGGGDGPGDSGDGVPGFGLGAGLAGVGGALSLLARRLG